MRAIGVRSSSSESSSVSSARSTGTLDRRAGHLAVPLRRVAVARREERAVDADRKVERRPRDELLAVDVAAGPTRWAGGVTPGLVGRHAQHAEEGRQRDLGPAIVDAFACLEPPLDSRRCVRERHAPRTGNDAVHADDERAAGLRAAHLHRPDERVPGVELLVVRLEPHSVLVFPTRIRAREGDRVAGIDRDDRGELARVVPVQRAPLERELVHHERGVPIQASRGASNTRRPSAATLLRELSERDGLPLVRAQRSSHLGGDVTGLHSSIFVPDRDRVRVVLVVGLRNERERTPGCEPFRLHVVDAVADARDRDDVDPRVVLADDLLGRGVAQPIAARRRARARDAAARSRDASPRRVVGLERRLRGGR